MFSTIEVRWFYKGAIPANVLAWFRQGEFEPRRQPPRTDYYLSLPDNDSIGVKIREGAVEVKQRQRQYGIEHFHDRVAGAVEHWQKWIFSLAVPNVATTEVNSSAASWIAVQKSRLWGQYKITAAAQAIAVSPDSAVTRGCSLELADVNVAGEDCWSFNLEAFGSEATLRDNLVLVARRVFAKENIPTFTAANSYSYPQWLRIVSAQKP